MAIAAVVDSGPRVNEGILAPKVRLVSFDGEQLGIKTKAEALEIASSQGLDLVEVAQNTDPPVCRVLDYSKYKYEIAQRKKESRKKRTHIVIKEMKYRPKISRGDLETKTRKVQEFLGEGNRVKVTIMFRGREIQHPEQGNRIIDYVKEATEGMAIVDSQPNLEGKNMTMVLMPDKTRQKKQKQEEKESEKEKV